MVANKENISVGDNLYICTNLPFSEKKYRKVKVTGVYDSHFTYSTKTSENVCCIYQNDEYQRIFTTLKEAQRW